MGSLDRPSIGHHTPWPRPPGATRRSSCSSIRPTGPCERHGQESCAGNRVADTRPAKSSCDPCEQRILRLFERLDRHLACNRGKLPKELRERMAALQIVDQILE